MFPEVAQYNYLSVLGCVWSMGDLCQQGELYRAGFKLSVYPSGSIYIQSYSHHQSEAAR